MVRTPAFQAAFFSLVMITDMGFADRDPLERIDQRFTPSATSEKPSFQRHVVPLLGRLGCNGRACHGSFQGRGGFRLSLFGYDFAEDHAALIDQDHGRINRENTADSLILTKPTNADRHEGGLRFPKNGWEYRVLYQWISQGAHRVAPPQKLIQLKIAPAEISFRSADETTNLQVTAHWEDGTQEDVTPLCRFKSNDEQICQVDREGCVTAGSSGDTHIVVSYDKLVVPVPVLRPVTDLVESRYPQIETPTRIDQLVVAKLRKLGIVPSAQAGDAEFLRRLRLDMTGSLPSVPEIEAFLANPDPHKRSHKIETLLKSPEHAAWWTTKLCDFTGNNDQQLNNSSPIGNRASRDWYEWILKRVTDNVPYDQLVEGIATATSRSPGQSYTEYCEQMSKIYREGKSYSETTGLAYYWARQDFRELEARAIGFAYCFMGIRIQCAQCHKHPFDKWTKDDFHQFKNFFARVNYARNGSSPQSKDEYRQLLATLGMEGKKGAQLRKALPKMLQEGKTIPFPEAFVTKRPIRQKKNNDDNYPVFEHAKLLGGDIVEIENGSDPRITVMNWLRAPENPFFARAFVNRVWASYFHRGIVEPADDLSLANPPVNESLLDYLAKGFIDSNFDMQWIHRTITNSATYQRSWIPNKTNQSDRKNFSHTIPRRLPAEVAYDAVLLATAADAEMESLHQDLTGRAITIPGTGQRDRQPGSPTYALRVFGRSTRDTNCDCDRSSAPSLLQTVFLQNDRDLLNLIDVRSGSWLNEIALEINPERAAQGKQSPKKINRLRKQIGKTRKELKTLKQQTESAEEIGRVEKRLQNLQHQLTALSPSQSSKQKINLATEQLRKLIRTAYLRTVSRPPAETEIVRAERHLLDSTDTLDGIRDLMWALINTKEFIVNH